MNFPQISCARPKLQNNLKANHNAWFIRIWGEVAVRDLSYRIIWKQITTVWPAQWQNSCCARPKLQNNLKANHNLVWFPYIWNVAVRDLSYRIIWKQITTRAIHNDSLQRCARPKLQNNLKANHNPVPSAWDGYRAVRDLSYRIIWKQITT